jgi:type VI secretion system protein ImpH
MGLDAATVPVGERLFSEPHRFDFFQAVRLLERLARLRTEADHKKRFAVGQDALPKSEVVRFRAHPSLSFAAGQLNQVRQPKSGPDDAEPPPEMAVSFFGLTGPAGVLPQHYTALLLRRVRAKDFALRDFLDVFHHRALSLFYRAWEKYRLPFAYERARLDPTSGQDLALMALFSLVGSGTERLRGLLQVDDEAFVYYAGHFAHLPRSASALEGILCDYFGMPVRVEQFQGQWLSLAREDLSRLSGSAEPRGLNNRLGVDAVAGERVWDVQGKFRLRVGPLPYALFRRFMPRRFGLKPLCQLTRSYVGPDLDFDVNLVLRREDVPLCRLGGDGSEGAFLGWNTWVRAGDFDHDADDALFMATDMG